MSGSKNSISSWKFIIFLLISLLCSFCFCFEVIIRNDEELRQVGGTSSCSLLTDEPICKSVPFPPGSRWWSSCYERECEISIIVGNLGGGLEVMPTGVAIDYFSGGVPPAEIRIRYRVRGVLGNLVTLPTSESWTGSPYYDLTHINGFDRSSEIVIRLASNAHNQSIDLLDKIIFSMDESWTSETSTPIDATFPIETSDPTDEPISAFPTDPIETSVSTQPPLPTNPIATTERIPETTTSEIGRDLIMDVEADVKDGWINVDCTYGSNLEDFDNKCPLGVPGGAGGRLGFWSSCGRPYCRIFFALGRYSNPLPPTSITINSFLKEEAQIRVRLIDRDISTNVGLIRGSNSWGSNTFDLTHLQLNDQAIISLEPSSSSYPNDADLIDKVVVSFS